MYVAAVSVQHNVPSWRSRVERSVSGRAFGLYAIIHADRKVSRCSVVFLNFMNDLKSCTLRKKEAKVKCLHCIITRNPFDKMHQHLG